MCYNFFQTEVKRNIINSIYTQSIYGYYMRQFLRIKAEIYLVFKAKD